MKYSLLVMMLAALTYGQDAATPATAKLYLAVLDKGPTTPPVYFVVDGQWTDKVHKKRWVEVPTAPGKHTLNFCDRIGHKDKHHKIDMEVALEAGQSRYFVMEMNYQPWPKTTFSGTSFDLHELSESEWKYRLQDGKPEEHPTTKTGSHD